MRSKLARKIETEDTAAINIYFNNNESETLKEISDSITKIINKNKAFSMHKQSAQSSNSSNGGSSPSYYRDTRIEEGKLFYEKRWFRRGQSVQV